METLLKRGWIAPALMLVAPFVLLGSAHLAGRLGGGAEAAFLLLLLCILSVYAALALGVLLSGAAAVLWLLGVRNIERSRLILLLLLSAANVAASVAWLRLFVRHVRFRY